MGIQYIATQKVKDNDNKLTYAILFLLQHL